MINCKYKKMLNNVHIFCISRWWVKPASGKVLEQGTNCFQNYFPPAKTEVIMTKLNSTICPGFKDTDCGRKDKDWSTDEFVEIISFNSMNDCFFAR